MREQDLLELCRQADATPEPPLGRLDMSDLVSRGRRNVRRRLALRSAAVLASLAVVGVGSAAAIDEVRARASSTPPQVADQPRQCGFSEITETFTVGWVPDGLPARQRSVGQDTHCNPIGLGHYTASASHAYLYGAKVEPPFEVNVSVRTMAYETISSDPSSKPALPVHGRRAFTGRSGDDSWLRWEHGSDTFMSVLFNNSGRGPYKPGSADEAEALRKVAESVRFTQSPVRLPFRLKERQKGYRPLSADIHNDGERRYGGIALVNPDGEGNNRYAVYVQTGRRARGVLDTKVDGHEARFRWEDDTRPTLTVVRDGVTIEVVTSQKVAKDMGGLDGLIAIYRQIELAPKVSDPATWITWPRS
jgi:hypothetical protein